MEQYETLLQHDGIRHWYGYLKETEGLKSAQTYLKIMQTPPGQGNPLSTRTPATYGLSQVILDVFKPESGKPRLYTNRETFLEVKRIVPSVTRSSVSGLVYQLYKQQRLGRRLSRSNAAYYYLPEAESTLFPSPETPLPIDDYEQPVAASPQTLHRRDRAIGLINRRQIYDLLKQAESGLNKEEIASQLRISHCCANTHLKALENEGRVKWRKDKTHRTRRIWSVRSESG